MITKDMEVTFQERGLPPLIDATQGDSGRNLRAHVADVRIPAGSSARFFALKPSGMAVYNDCTVDGDTVTIELTNQVLAEPGRVQAQIEILGEDGRISTFRFIIHVEPTLITDEAIESFDETTVLERLVESAKQDAGRAETAADEAEGSAQAAAGSAKAAKDSQDAAAKSEANATTKAGEAAQSADESENWANQSQSWAVGTGYPDREDQATENSKAYAEKSKASAKEAASSQAAANESAGKAAGSASAADTSAQAAETAEGAAETAAQEAKDAAQAAKGSQDAAAGSAQEAKDSQDAAAKSEANATTKAGEAAQSAQEAKDAQAAAAGSATEAKEAEAGAQAAADEAKGSAEAAAGSAQAAAESAEKAKGFASGDIFVQKIGDTMTGTLVLSKDADVSGTSYNQPALVVGGTPEQAHIEIDNNEIVAKANETGVAQLNLNQDGGVTNVGGDFQLGGTAPGARSIKYVSGTRTGTPLSFYPGDANGSGVVIGDGGRTIIGSGESAQNLRNALGTAPENDTSEEMHIGTDQKAFVHTNCQNVTQRKTFTFDADGTLNAPAGYKVNGADLVKQILLQAYPVGSIYMSTSDVNPSQYFGGTWAAWGTGRVPVGVDGSDTNMNAADKTGGAKTVSLAHTHTVASHTHSVGAHAHGLNSHTHSVPAHAHGMNNHTHSVPAHAHGLNSHTHSIAGHKHISSAGYDENYYYIALLYDSVVKTSSVTGSGNGSAYAFNVGTGNSIHANNLRLGYTDTVSLTTKAASGNTAEKAAFTSGKATGNTANSAVLTSGAATGNTANSTAFNTGGAAPATDSKLSGNQSIMQPYVTCYMWKRTA